MKHKASFPKVIVIALLGVAMSVLMVGGPARADTTIDQTFVGFPTPLPYTQQDKSYDGFSDPGGWFTVANNKTDLKTQVFVSPSHDVHTVTFSGTFPQSGSYDIFYSISVIPNSPLYITSVGIGIDQSFGQASATLEKIVKDANGNVLLDQTITGNVPDYAITPEKELFIEDIFTNNGAGVNSISNSFVETPVPVPGALLLFAPGLVGLAAIRRRFKK